MHTTTKAALLAAATTAAFTGAADAQTQAQQKVTGPEAIYWISAETQAGLPGMPALPGFNPAAVGPGGVPRMPTPADYGQPGLKNQLGVAAGESAAQIAGARIGGYEGEAVARLGGMLSRGLGNRGKKKPETQAAPVQAEPEVQEAAASANYVRGLTLQLGSSRKASAEPAAEHLIPAGLRAGKSLPLKTPKVERPTGGYTPGYTPGEAVQPRGKMVVYWGCGEKAAAAPIVIDFAKLGTKGMAAMPSINVRTDTPPAQGRHATYGEWPNDLTGVVVPPNGSLTGQHTIKGNYSPEIAFALNGSQDFLAPLVLSGPAPTAGGGAKLSWAAVPNAAGYFAQAMGSNGDETMVFWASSAKAVGFSQLMDYLPEAEVRRLVSEKVVLAPTVTECVIPAEVVKALGSGMVQMIAYGEEANFVDPPRPTDPKVSWDRTWTVKLRRKSTAMAMLGAAD